MWKKPCPSEKLFLLNAKIVAITLHQFFYQFEQAVVPLNSSGQTRPKRFALLLNGHLFTVGTEICPLCVCVGVFLRWCGFKSWYLSVSALHIKKSKTKGLNKQISDYLLHHLNQIAFVCTSIKLLRTLNRSIFTLPLCFQRSMEKIIIIINWIYHCDMLM